MAQVPTRKPTLQACARGVLSWQVNGLQQYRARFDNNGNITQKTDVSSMGFYTYDQTRQHAVTEISEPTSAYLSVAASPQQISYTAFNKAESIMEDNSLPGPNIKLDRLDITYGPDNMRKMTDLYLNNNLRKTKHFIGGNYEEERKTDGSMRKLHYISGGDGVCAIYVQNGTNDTMYYIQKDHLGSYYCVTGEDGAVILLNDREEQIYSFDPWGRRRSPQTWDYTGIQTEFLFDRGFTGHEHLDKFNLINMNGRVYDPWIGRFLSPDIIVQSPQYSQSYNRYSYVFNNPLKYIDPTGYEGGPNGNPPPYAYGEGSASPGMGFYAFKAMPWGQMSFSYGMSSRASFMNSGFARIDAIYQQDKARAVIRELWENSTMSTFSGVEAREIFTMMKLGFDFRIVEAFGTAVLVMAQGELGEIQYGENGGIDFANETAGVYFGTAVVGGSAQAGGGDGWVFGQSIDITLATPGGGYNIEGGWFLGNNGKQGSQFVSHGVAYGVEASVGWNMIFINPKSNFKFSDLEGMGASWTLNFWILSISAFGNSSPGYPENSVFDTYKGFKIGIGAGIGGSTAPNSNTTFQNWMPNNIQYMNFHWH